MSNTPPETPYRAPAASLNDTQADGAELAGLGQRLGAAIIDAVINMIVIFPVLIIAFGGFLAWGQYVAEHQILGSLIGLILGSIVFLVIHGKFLADNGQTIGKKLLGIKIVRSNGDKADFTHIVTRRFLPMQAMAVFPFIGGLLSLVNICLIFRDSRQCGHDMIADTKVIRCK